MNPSRPSALSQADQAGLEVVNTALDAQARGDFAAAERLYRALLEADAHHGIGHNNLANLLRQSGRLGEAVVHYQRALEGLPDSAPVHANLADTFETMGQYEAAESEYRRALERDPTNLQARYNYGLLLLAAGRYAEGWPYFEARTEVFREHGTLPFARWNGEDLRGKTLLLLPEQGYGDTIQFVRYVRLLKALGVAKLSLICKPALAPLLRTVQGIDALITDQQDLQVHDYWDSLLSLPARFGTTLASVPAEIPYVGVFGNRLDAWRARLPADGIKVGLVWKGNPQHDNDAARSLPHFSTLRPLWALRSPSSSPSTPATPNVHFISLQVGGAEAEARSCASEQPTLCLGDEIRDFADTAAIVGQLNLVICVDTAVAHLAGALGVACWLMLPRERVDWRWLRRGMQSPWYPKDMYLFRQGEAGWAGVVEEIRQALAEIVQARR
jgi:hypothetical protein